MEIKEFSTLNCYNNLLDIENPKVGDKFLTGSSMIGQKESKTIGSDISWYEITFVGQKGQLSYTTRYGVLKKPKGDR